MHKTLTNSMTKLFRNLGILIFPFVIMITVNEIVRHNISEKQHSAHIINGIRTINSKKNLKDNCTWICYYQTTNICKKKHVKYLTEYYKYTDSFYFGIINTLHNTGSYKLANIIFLVILCPSLIWVFVIKSLSIQSQIKKLKN